MPSPASANRTLWLNASDADHLYKDTAGGPGSPSGTPTNGDPVALWKSEDDATILGDSVTNAKRPTWGSAAGMLVYDGTDDQHLMVNSANSPRPMSDYLTDTAYTIFVVFQLTSDATNIGTIYQNTAVWLDAGANIGIHFKTSGGTSTVHAVNRSGASTWDSVSKTINQSQTYVVMIRLQSGTLYVSINNGSEGSVASGTTNSLVYQAQISYNPQTPNYFPGKVGEILVYNAALTGSNFTDTMSYLMDKWVTTSNFSVSPKDSFELVGGLGAQDFVSMLIDGDRLNLREALLLDNNYVLKLTAQAFDSLFYGLGDNATAAILNTLLTVSKSDALSLSDARQLRLLIARTAADIFTIADDRYLRLQYRLRPTDVLGLSDLLAVSAQLAAQSVSQSDSLSLSDSLVASPVVSSQIRISIDN